MTNETIFIIKLISRKSTNREFTILIYSFVIKLKEMVKNTCILGTFVILSLLQKFFCIYFSMWEGS